MQKASRKMSERLFKVLDGDRKPCHGGRGRWDARKWMPPIEGIGLCGRGYHLCRADDLVRWLGPVIYEATWRGERLDGDHKIVVSEARLVRRLTTWNERTARLFGTDCAEAVLALIPEPGRTVCAETIAVTRRFADGKATRGELAVAKDAARAAGAAAWASGEAAKNAAWASGEAAKNAAWAAGDAAQNAVWAAGAAAGAKQARILMGYLYPGEA